MPPIFSFIDPRIPTLADVDMWLRRLLRYDVADIAEPLLRVAPHEAGHHNTVANWRVRAEHGLIYALNSVRRYLGQAHDRGVAAADRSDALATARNGVAVLSAVWPCAGRRGEL